MLQEKAVSQRRFDLDWLRVLAILTVFIFHIIMALYEFLIRRVNVLRFLFGMKVEAKDRVRSSNVMATSVAQNSSD